MNHCWWLSSKLELPGKPSYSCTHTHGNKWTTHLDPPILVCLIVPKEVFINHLWPIKFESDLPVSRSLYLHMGFLCTYIQYTVFWIIPAHALVRRNTPRHYVNYLLHLSWSWEGKTRILVGIFDIAKWTHFKNRIFCLF